ncbi:MAG: NAD(P)-binding domain-containing protein [Thermoleophilia bacterium]
MKVAILGAGKMGECIARCFLKDELTIYDTDIKRARSLSKKLGCQVATAPDHLYKYPNIFLALHKDETIDEVSKILSASRTCSIITLSTYINEKDLPIEKMRESNCSLYIIKVIGHYLVPRGWTFLSSDTLPQDIKERLKFLGTIIDGTSKDYYSKINPTIAELSVGLARTISELLDKEELGEEIISSAVTSVAAGTLMEFPWIEPDIFLKSILKGVGGYDS